MINRAEQKGQFLTLVTVYLLGTSLCVSCGQQPLYGMSRVSVDHGAGGGQMQDESRYTANQDLTRQLVSERHQVLQAVSFQNGILIH